MSESKRLPVYTAGGIIAAWALVDDDDFERLSEHRWYLRPEGYITRRKTIGVRQRQLVYLHRDIMGLGPAVRVDGQRIEVDHINRDRLDNRKANLRICTGRLNSQNVPARGGSSAYRGVSWCPAANKWQASVCFERKLRYLGIYETEEEAAAVASAFRAEHMPFSEDAALAAGGVIHA